MACKCGSNEFSAFQVCRHDIVVDSQNNYIRGLCGQADQDIYDSDDPYGPYTCMRCHTQYDDIPQDKCEHCKGFGFLLSTRYDIATEGVYVIERCDACSPHMSDQDALKLVYELATKGGK